MNRLILLCGVLLSCLIASRAEPAKVEDPTGILRKPIPDKLVVLSFDDSCASHATIVGPILKPLKFGATFYVCCGFAFHSRKDWYLTWRQMKTLAADGFEIGNHTHNHMGGAPIGPFLSMEDELLAHGVPKPTTVCWPVYQVNTGTYPDLTANGYTFGRGGYERPYRPTIDHPLDVPSFTIHDGVPPEKFVAEVRQATGGKVVVFCYHGVPDGEHPGIGLTPTAFKDQMRYLKDNNYKVIAMRDLVEYIDPAKAAKLPPTANGFAEPSPVVLAEEIKPMTVTKDSAPPAPPTPVVPVAKPQQAAYPPENRVLKFDKDGSFDEPATLDKDLYVDIPGNLGVKMPAMISGPGRLIKNGDGRLVITNPTNNFAGGTVVNAGGLMMFVPAHGAAGTGPIEVNEGGTLELEAIQGTNPLTINGGKIYAGNSGDSWDAPIIVKGNAKFSIFGQFNLNYKSGGISGPGSVTIIDGGTATFYGTNTYTGITNVSQGRLVVQKPLALYNGNQADWVPAKITVASGTSLHLELGGKDGFTGAQTGTLLKNLSTGINHNGLMAHAIFGLNITSATEAQELSTNIADSQGAGGGAFIFKKCGLGILKLSGKNSYTGRTILEGGTLSVDSINRVEGGLPASNLGAPASLEGGIIGIHGDCCLTYTGKGEITDRIVDLTGQKQTVTFDQSGSGLLKFTSPFDISGFAHPKTIILQGSTAGTGELAADFTNPYDRNRTATLAFTKAGTGTWVLSGKNSYTGPTTVTQGTLALSTVSSLGPASEVTVAEGAMLDLRFKGEIKVSKLTLGGVVQPAGTYSAANAEKFIKGSGVLRN